MTLEFNTRKYAMNKPVGHSPAIQRYSSRVEDEVKQVRLLILGQQSQVMGIQARKDFLSTLSTVFNHIGRPLHHDLATYTDPEGFENTFAVCYWQDEETFRAWKRGFDSWWMEQDPSTMDRGLWVESFAVPVEYRETIAFKEYIRGLSACPMSKIEPMNESGYWGAARDRLPASAHDDLAPACTDPLKIVSGRDTLKKRIAIRDAPSNLCVIRSGVSWAECGEEQLASYQQNLEPKLNEGMDYLRQNPVKSGCCSLRQVTCLNEDGSPAKEAYSLGLFQSFNHLEEWSHNHPTHLVIYTRAQAERKKYQERLELRTYHEVYVLNEETSFDYLNCHPKTGLLPYFSAEVTG
ncbi:MAG: phenylacetaldoxime dehydratase family protein [Stappiaceae bacterium]